LICLSFLILQLLIQRRRRRDAQRLEGRTQLNGEKVHIARSRPPAGLNGLDLPGKIRAGG
jgi:hypothetical protein